MPTNNITKKVKSKTSSRYPVERVQTYTLAPGQTILIDVAKTLSAQNHRLYRQGKLYHCKISLYSMGPDPSNLRFQKMLPYAVPDTWYVKKAWELAFATREEQLAASNRDRGRWDDFRVGWSSTYQTGQLGEAADGAQLVADEAQLAKVHDSTDSADFGFVMFGSARDAGNNLYGMIEQYDQTGNTMTNQPHGNAVTDAYTQAHPDAGLIESAGDLLALQGDDAPYDMDSFNGADDGGAVALPMLSSSPDSSGRGSISCFLPLGLLKVTNQSVTVADQAASAQVIQVTVSPGNYKGVKALDW